jgi:hypothetical protein
MPPEAVWQGEIGFGGPELDVGYAPAWTFCEERNLAAPRLTIVPPERNVTIIRQTTNVTNYVTINNRIVNKSVDVHHIEKVSNTHITPVHVREVDRPMSSAARHATNSEVQVFRPTKKPQATSKEPTRQQEIVNKHQGPEIATPQNQQNPKQPKKPQAPIPTSRDVTRQQEIVNKHQNPAIATPQNQQNPQQQRENERQKQQEEQKRRLQQLQCQQNPAACPAQ